jgi:DDE family transposase
MKAKITPEATVSQVSAQIRYALTQAAQAVSRESGFVRRRSKLDGAAFVQTVVLGWLANPRASLDELAHTAASVGVAISPQGLEQRFTAAAAGCLQQVLARAVCQRLHASGIGSSLLDRFPAVYVRDSTVINLPTALSRVWPGCGGRTGMTQAALKVQVQYDLKSGQIVNLDLTAGRASDRTAASQHTLLPAGSLRLADLGYFSLDVLREQPDTYFLVRPQSSLVVYCAAAPDHAWHLADLLRTCTTAELDVAVLIGAGARIPGRLLARRAPRAVAQQRRRRLNERARKSGRPVSAATRALADWTLFLTNVPQERLTLDEAFILAGCRWQIELLFKLWKSQGHLDDWRSQKPWRILCEVYAKLLGLLVLHWLCLPTAWRHLDRSLVKAAHVVQQFTQGLACTLATPRTFRRLLEALLRCLDRGCRQNRSRKAPRTFQLLEALA